MAIISLEEISGIVTNDGSLPLHEILERATDLGDDSYNAHFPMVDEVCDMVCLHGGMRHNAYHNQAHTAQVVAYCLYRYSNLPGQEKSRVRLLPLVVAALIHDYDYGSTKVRNCTCGQGEGSFRSFVFDMHSTSKGHVLNTLVDDDVLALVLATNPSRRNHLRNESSEYSSQLKSDGTFKSACIISDADMAGSAYLGVDSYKENTSRLEREVGKSFSHDEKRNFLERVAGAPLTSGEDSDEYGNYLATLAWLRDGRD